MNAVALVLGILGVTALVEPIPFAGRLATIDVWVMLAATLAMLAAGRSGWRFSRSEGALFLLLYAIYLGCLARVATAV